MKLHKALTWMAGTACSMLLLTAALIAAPTQARYDNVNSFTTVYAPAVQTVTSNYLTPEGQNVLLGAWENVTPGAARTVGLTLALNAGEAQLSLSCTTQSPYLTAQVLEEPLALNTGGYMTDLKLTATEAAQALTQPETAVVTVTATATGIQSSEPMVLQASFQVIMLSGEIAQPESENIPTYIEVEQSEAELTFAWDEKLVFSLKVEGSADTLELMYNGDVFPAGTRYQSADGALTVLAEPMLITLPIDGSGSYPVWLDFSQTEQEPDLQPTIIAEVLYEGKYCNSHATFKAPATRQSFSVTVDALPVIRENGSLVAAMTGDAEGLSWTLEWLSDTQEGYLTSQDNFFLTVQPDSTQQTLTVSNAAAKAPAGTYRLTLTRHNGEVILSTCQLFFFIRY